MDSETRTMVEMAATIRKAVSFPAYARGHEAHTDGMAELIAHLTRQNYAEVRAAIVDAEEADPRTVAEASQELVKTRPAGDGPNWGAFDRWLRGDEEMMP